MCLSFSRNDAHSNRRASGANREASSREKSAAQAGGGEGSVFRPTSPMSVGSWILVLSGAANTAGFLLGSRSGPLGALGRIGIAAGGGLGALLAGYTGVLLANTAVPLWQAARRQLPVLFVGSGMASAGAVLELFADSGASRRLTHWYGSAGKAVALGAMLSMQRSARRAPRVTEPLRNGATGSLWRAIS